MIYNTENYRKGQPSLFDILEEIENETEKACVEGVDYEFREIELDKEIQDIHEKRYNERIEKIEKRASLYDEYKKLKNKFNEHELEFRRLEHREIAAASETLKIDLKQQRDELAVKVMRPIYLKMEELKLEIEDLGGFTN